MSKLPKQYKAIEKFFKRKGLRLDDYEDDYYTGEREDED